MIYTLDQIRAAIKPIAEKYKLPAVYIFGSYARGTANEESDIDFLVDMTNVKLPHPFGAGALYNDIQEAFQKEIDFVTVASLLEDQDKAEDASFCKNVLNERVCVYAVA